MAKKKSRNGGEDDTSPRRRGRAANPKTKARRRSFLGRIFYWTLVLVTWVGIIGTGAAAYVVLSVSAPDVYRLPERERGIVVLAANGEVLAHRGVFQGDQIRLDELPDYVPEAVIAIEDRRFYSHFGVDPIGLIRAAYANMRSGRIVQGGSTITQQLAKNLFLQPERTYKRKLQELVLALWLEYTYSKEEILQLYVNRVYFGGGAYGVEAAAQRFFDKSARYVNLPEAAMLAGALKAPSRYSPTASRERSRARAALVLDAMVRSEFISPIDGRLAVDNPAALARVSTASAKQYIVDWIAELVPSFVAASENNLIVHTTIDIEMQEAAEAVVRRHLDANGTASNVSQAAAVVMTPRGEIRALIGGASYAQSQYNRAVQAQRQPGSAFKPFVYLAALENGLTPETIRVDEPFRIGDWQPRNYSGRHYGPVSLRQGLVNSLNTIAVRLTMELGVGEVVERARRLGIRTPLHNNASLALGTAEVILLELTGAYGSFANGGFGVLPHVITQITTTSGELVYRRDGSGAGRVIEPRHVGAMNDMLSQVIREGTGRRGALGEHPAAGKTGTSQDSRDAWFVGYTAALVAGVWTGNDDGTPMRDVTGGGLPTEIWRDIMMAAMRGYAPAPLPGGGAVEPRGIVDILRNFSVATIQDFLRGDTADAPRAPTGGGTGGSSGSFVDEISESTR